MLIPAYETVPELLLETAEDVLEAVYMDVVYAAGQDVTTVPTVDKDDVVNRVVAGSLVEEVGCTFLVVASEADTADGTAVMAEEVATVEVRPPWMHWEYHSLYS